MVVQVTQWRHGVRIAVTDQGSGKHPVIHHPDGELTENGSGLYLVRQLSQQLGWHDDASGRTVYATLGTHQPRRCGRPGSQASHVPKLPQPA